MIGSGPTSPGIVSTGLPGGISPSCWPCPLANKIANRIKYFILVF